MDWMLASQSCCRWLASLSTRDGGRPLTLNLVQPDIGFSLSIRLILFLETLSVPLPLTWAKFLSGRIAFPRVEVTGSA